MATLVTEPDMKVTKFGRNSAVGTSFVPICAGGNYQMPQAAGAQQLRVRAGGNANDTAAGTGARKIRLEGLGADGGFLVNEIDTAGASASSYSTDSFMRLFRIFIAESGTYANQSASSHAANIIIEDSGANEWGRMIFDGIGRARSLIGAYTTADGFAAEITRVNISVDGNKTADILLVERRAILATAAPYEPMEAVLEWNGLSGVNDFEHQPHTIEVPNLTDVVMFGRVASGTADISVRLSIGQKRQF